MAQQPIEFNNKMSEISDSLQTLGLTWGTKLAECIKSKNFTSLTPLRKRMLDFADRNISNLKSMKDVKNSYEYRMAMINFLQVEKKIVNDYFIPFEKFNSDTPEPDVNKRLIALSEIKEEEIELNKLREIQSNYAAANGFLIQTEEESDKD